MRRPRPVARMRDVARSDLAAFLAIFFLVMFWLMVVVLGVYSQMRVLAAQAPYFTVYILVGAVTTLCCLSVALRTYRVNLVLANGKRVAAKVDRYFAFQVYAQVWLTYKAGGEMVQQRVWLAATTFNSRLADMEEVELFLPHSPGFRPVVGDLYRPA